MEQFVNTIPKAENYVQFYCKIILNVNDANLGKFSNWFQTKLKSRFNCYEHVKFYIFCMLKEVRCSLLLSHKCLGISGDVSEERTRRALRFRF